MLTRSEGRLSAARRAPLATVALGVLAGAAAVWSGQAVAPRVWPGSGPPALGAAARGWGVAPGSGASTGRLVLAQVAVPASQAAPTSRPDEGGREPLGPELFPLVRRGPDGRLEWTRPRFAERQAEREAMVATQIAVNTPFQRGVSNAAVLAAMRAVPRHEFVPAARREAAYDDTPLPIGHGQTISQPYIVALMTELLRLEPGDRVLEIGTGSGYQAAVLSELTPYVFTIEIIEPLHRQSARRLGELGYRTIQTRHSDGYEGWPEAAPFDAIIVTCAAGHVPPPLWQQLRPGGRMVIPIGDVYDTQRLVVLSKQADGSRRSENVLPVRFVPMTGRMQGP